MFSEVPPKTETMTSFTSTARLSMADWTEPLPWFGRSSKQFGQYLVQRRLASGSMAVVYRALDTLTQRQVALKVLHQDIEMRERFLREARILAGLSHPNVCNVYEIGEQDGDLFLVMELLHGETLRTRIRRGRCRPEEVRKIAVGVAQALQAAHAQGVVHRDLKPENVFLTIDIADDKRGVKLLDFGLASSGCERERNAEREDMRRLGATVGTVGYMSPEQACGEVLDPRSDMFSLGVVLYEMATGQAPFQGTDCDAVLFDVMNRDPVPPCKVNPELPADLEDAICALLAKQREERVPSADVLLQMLSA